MFTRFNDIPKGVVRTLARNFKFKIEEKNDTCIYQYAQKRVPFEDIYALCT